MQAQDSSKYRPQARQLQELFPTWSNDDLLLLLAEVNGDLQLAATKISDGTVQPWGEVSRKKDKKAPAPVSHRGDSRGGARGGRGGRGGPGRGGAVSRGGPPRAAAPRPAANGHAPQAEVNGDLPEKPVPDAHEHTNGTIPPSTSAWTDTTSSHTETATLPTSVSSPNSAWGASSEPPNGHAHVTKQPSKTPATSKLSWAQIARPQEKPAPPPHPTPSAQAPPPPPVEEPHPEPQQSGWEEPTTAEAPTWDEPKPSEPAEAWPPSKEPAPEPKPDPVPEPKHEEPPAPAVPEPKPDPKPVSPVPAPAQQTTAPVSALPAQVATPSPKLAARPQAAVSHRNSARYKVTDQAVTLPVSFGTGIEKVGMQFGSLSLGGDVPDAAPEAEAPAAAPEPAPPTKPVIAATPPPPPPATAPAASTSLTSVFHQQQQTQAQIAPQPPAQTQSQSHHTLPTSVSQPISSNQQTAHAASPLQSFAPQQSSTQQTLSTAQQQLHQQPPHLHQQHHQHVQHLPQQTHTPAHSYPHGLASSHIEPTAAQTQQAQTAVQQQTLPSTAHSTYFRGQESATTPYFHTPTPPAAHGAQSQDTGYGSFGQLGGQGQHQASHLGAFGANDYGYNDTSRGFYDTYAQQGGFASRNPLGHDDVKGSQQSATSLPPASTTGPQSHTSQNSNAPQPAGAQGPQQNYPPAVPYYYPNHYPQPQYYGSPYSSGYVPQPPPFVKYQTMFQPGPPGTGSTGNPANKQPGGNVGVGQPQTNPYNQALYQQAGYDDYQGHPAHHSQHQHTHSLGLGQGGVGSGQEYGKQLYGGGAGHGGQGMQGFMGLGGQSGGGSTVPASTTGPRGAAGSPETTYKPYGAGKDVGVASGRGAPVQGSQGQGQAQGQSQGQSQGGPQGQPFYGGNRFGSGVGGAGVGGVGGVGGGPQQGGHHQQGGPQAHLYPQAGSEPNFYGYQPRQQQGYWQ